MSMGEYDDRLPAADAQAFACTMLQERFFAQQRSRGPQGLNISMRWLVTGALSHAAAEGALQALVRRHEILRTSFREIDGRLAQEVHPSCPVKLNAIDLTALPAEERESRAEEIARAEAVTPIDPAVAPLLRSTLLRLAPDRGVLLLTLHSLICDGWSTGLIVSELRAAAEAIDDGRAPDATPPDLQFADYAAWQNELLASGELDEARAYWMRQLRGASATPVPADHALPTGTRPGERSNIASLLLPGELSAAFESFARKHDATLFGLAVAALGLMLHRVTGSAEIVFGSQVANREEPEAAELVGPTVNSITLCLPVDDATTLHGFVGVANERVQEALRHQRLPFEIAENFAARRDGRPLHAANLVLHRSYSGTTETERDGAGRFDLVSLPSFSSGTQWPLNFYMISRDEGWRLSCEADAGLYEPATVKALLDAWRLCLETLATAPDGPLTANVALAGIAAPSGPLPSGRPAVARGEPIPVHEPERQVVRFHEDGPRTPMIVLNNRSVYFQLARQLGEQRPFTDILMYHQDGPAGRSRAGPTSWAATASMAYWPSRRRASSRRWARRCRWSRCSIAGRPAIARPCRAGSACCAASNSALTGTRSASPCSARVRSASTSWCASRCSTISACCPRKRDRRGRRWPASGSTTISTARSRSTGRRPMPATSRCSAATSRCAAGCSTSTWAGSPWSPASSPRST